MHAHVLPAILDSLAVVLDTADETGLLDGQPASTDDVRSLVYGLLGQYAGLTPWGTLPTPEQVREALSQDTEHSHGPGL